MILHRRRVGVPSRPAPRGVLALQGGRVRVFERVPRRRSSGFAAVRADRGQVSVNDVADRAPRALADGELLVLGRRARRVELRGGGVPLRPVNDVERAGGPLLSRIGGWRRHPSRPSPGGCRSVALARPLCHPSPQRPHPPPTDRTKRYAVRIVLRGVP